ncbi:hypothetical protein [Escherichia phage BI-EHEC]|nr:hypothetical protein [Escherichia phage BI-EHEC]
MFIGTGMKINNLRLKTSVAMFVKAIKKPLTNTYKVWYSASI